jgi:hypothetical protein
MKSAQSRASLAGFHPGRSATLVSLPLNDHLAVGLFLKARMLIEVRCGVDTAGDRRKAACPKMPRPYSQVFSEAFPWKVRAILRTRPQEPYGVIGKS